MSKKYFWTALIMNAVISVVVGIIWVLSPDLTFAEVLRKNIILALLALMTAIPLYKTFLTFMSKKYIIGTGLVTANVIAWVIIAPELTGVQWLARTAVVPVIGFVLMFWDLPSNFMGFIIPAVVIVGEWILLGYDQSYPRFFFDNWVLVVVSSFVLSGITTYLIMTNIGFCDYTQNPT